MKRILKRHLKPLLLLALLALTGMALCGCMPKEDCEHEFELFKGKAYVMDSPEKEIPNVRVLPIASCGERGYWYDEYICAKCSGIIYRRSSDELVIQQHDMYRWTYLVQPTCTQAGTEKRHCLRDCCFTNGDGELGEHQYVEVEPEDPASCTDSGFTALYRCKVCNTAEKGGEEIPALGHSYENGVCTRCGEPEALTPGNY